MNKVQWKKELNTYTTPVQVAKESLEGLSDHLNTRCNKSHTRTVATQNAGRRGLPPFHEEPVVCDRGTSGCNLVHNDGMALEFSLMAFERIVELGA